MSNKSSSPVIVDIVQEPKEIKEVDHKKQLELAMKILALISIFLAYVLFFVFPQETTGFLSAIQALTVIIWVTSCSFFTIAFIAYRIDYLWS